MRELTASKNNLIIASMAANTFLYGWLSSATPNNIEETEIAMALLMAFSLLLSLTSTIKNQAIYLIYTTHVSLLFIGLLIGISKNQSIEHIIRDAVPWAYLALSLRLLSSARLNSKSDKYRKLLILSSCGAGFLFIVRHFLDPANLSSNISDIGSTTFTTSGEYYLIEPLVLFFGLYSLHRLLIEKKIKIKLFFTTLFIIFLAASASQILRGYFACCTLIFVILLYQRKINHKTIAVFLALTLLATLFKADQIIDQFVLIYNSLAQKQIAVGSNSRMEEIVVITEALTNSISFFLLGTGFGGSLDFGYGTFRYTHNYITYLVMKFGFIISIFYLATKILLIKSIIIKRKLIDFILQDPAITCAMISIIYFIMIQPGYKMLGLYILVYLTGLQFIHKSTLAQEENYYANPKKRH